MNFSLLFLLSLYLIASGLAQSPKQGTLAVDTQIPLITDGKTVGSMTLKAGSKVNILNILPNDEVLISRWEGEPVKISKTKLVEEVATPASTASPVPTLVVQTQKHAQTQKTPTFTLPPEHDTAITNNDPKTLSKLIGDEITSLPIECGDTPTAVRVTDSKNNGFNLASLRGHVVVLGFYTLYSKKDHSEQANTFDQPLALAEQVMGYPEAKTGDLVALIATPEDSTLFAPFLQENGYTSKPIYDPSDSIRKALHLYGRPIVIIDREGRVVFQRRLLEFASKPKDAFYKVLRCVLDKKANVKPAPTPKNFSASINRTLYDFEDGFQGWKLTGDCWGSFPANDALYPGLVGGYKGKRFLSSFREKGVKGTGIAVSPDFVIDRNFLHLLVAGTDLTEDCAVALICDGKAIKQTTGDNSCQLRPVCWDITQYAGKTAQLEVYDAAKAGPRDYIMLDEVILSDSSVQPESYAQRYDPDDENCINASKKELPPEYKALTEGDFHQEATSGRAYYLEMNRAILWPTNSAGPFCYETEYFPSDFAQKIKSVSLTITMGNQQFEAVSVPTHKRMNQKKLSVTIPTAFAYEIKSASAKFTCEATINKLRLCKGPSTEKETLSMEEEAAFTRPGDSYPFDGPWFNRYMTEHKLWKYPSETDAAYLLRATRFFQRSFYYAWSPWEGWPSNQPWVLSIFERHATACNLVQELTMLLRANKIPSISGQGFWLNENGDRVGPHVRAIVHLKKSGWLLLNMVPEVYDMCGQFKEGYKTDDNFMQELDDNSNISNYPSTVNLGWLNGGLSHDEDWWRTWTINSPQPASNH